MSFCPVCGRDHNPGPCPIPFIEPDSPYWESDQYKRIAIGVTIAGLLSLSASFVMPVAVLGFRIVGGVAIAIGIASFILARSKRNAVGNKT